MRETISVVMCTRDRPDLIGQAVTSVASCDHPEIEIHVMDQSTDDATERVVDDVRNRFAGRARIVYHHLEVAGLSRAYNAGFRVTTSDIVACTDDDVIVDPGWLSAIERAFASDPELGLLYGQVLVPESLRDQGPDTIVPSLTWARRERLFHADRNFKVWGMGANMAIRRRAFEKVGGFDEIMGGGAPLRSSQDYDFSLRTYRAHFAVLLDPDVQVDHYGARRADQWPATERAYGIGDGAFYGKHIRCRDLLALRLLAQRLGRAVAKAGVESVRRRRPVPPNVYSRSIITGLRDGARFGVDRELRLYRETATARFAVTEANAVAGTAQSA